MLFQAYVRCHSETQLMRSPSSVVRASYINWPPRLSLARFDTTWSQWSRRVRDSKFPILERPRSTNDQLFFLIYSTYTLSLCILPVAWLTLKVPSKATRSLLFLKPLSKRDQVMIQFVSQLRKELIFTRSFQSRLLLVPQLAIPTQ